jgi:hypothetical protein
MKNSHRFQKDNDNDILNCGCWRSLSEHLIIFSMRSLVYEFNIPNAVSPGMTWNFRELNQRAQPPLEWQQRNRCPTAFFGSLVLTLKIYPNHIVPEKATMVELA